MIQRSTFLLTTKGFLLVAVASAWLIGIFLCSLLPFTLPPLFPLIAACGTLLAFLLLPLAIRSRIALLLLTCMLFGGWRYTLALPGNDPQALSTFIGLKNITIRGVVVDEPKLQGKTRLLLVAASALQTKKNGAWQEAHGRLEVLTPGIAIESLYSANYSDTITVNGTLQIASVRHTPGVFTSMTFPRINVLNKGNTPLTYLYHLRVQCATLLSQLFPQTQAALLIALFLSLHTPALSSVSQDFNVTGTSHLLAPSGFKVTIIAGLVEVATRWLYAERRSRTFSPLPAQRRRSWRGLLSTILTLLAILLYTAFNGFVPAAVRAGLMGCVLRIGRRIERPYNVYNALALAALVITLSDPFALWDVGFLLSFLGTLGIILLTPFFQRLLHPLSYIPLGHQLIDITAVTLAAQTATFPIIAIVFDNISFIAVPANLLTVPLLGIFLLAGLLLSIIAFCWLPLAMICSWAINPLLSYTLSIVHWCSQLPYAYTTVSGFSTVIAWGYYGALLLLLIPMRKFIISATQDRHAAEPVTPYPQLTTRHWRIIQACIALLFMGGTGLSALIAPASAQLTITFLAVAPAGQLAQGEAILIRTPDHKTALIDGGLDAVSLAQQLDKRLPLWQRKLDLVLLTTPRPDDIGGLQDVVTRYQIGEVLDAGMLHPNTTYAAWRHVITQRAIPYQAVFQGTSIALGTQVVLQVLWPMHTLHKGGDEERNNALILRLIAPGLSVLFLGAAAQSTYALSMVRQSIDTNYLHAQIVHMVGAVGKKFPVELNNVLQLVQPSWIVVTPAALSAKQRHIPGITTQLPMTGVLADTTSITGTGWHVLQTAQGDGVEASSDGIHWNISSL